MFIRTLAGYLPAVLMIAFIMGVGTVEAASKPEARNLLTNYLSNPLGIDTPEPRFSWQFVQEGRGTRQSAYQIQVADSLSDLQAGRANLWDSGKVKSNRVVAVPLKGKKLSTGKTYYWRVKVWDAKDNASDFSPAAWFEMGLLNPDDWKGEWITAPVSTNGYHSALENDVNLTKWVQVDLGEPKEFKSVRIFPCRPYNWYATILPGFGFPPRYRLEASNDPDFGESTLLADRTDSDQTAPEKDPVRIDFDKVTARYVRMTVTKLYTQADNRKLFALAELQVLGENDANLAIHKPVTALDSYEESGWSVEHLTEGSQTSGIPRGIAPLFRHEFEVGKPIKRARAYVTGLGYYELYLNGGKVGDEVLSPAYTTFGKRVLYSTVDVTDQLRQGRNALGAILGRGWFGGPPRFIAQVNIDFADGTSTSVVTNGGWKRDWSPITDNSIYHGETYDARKEQPGWDTPGFDDSAWGPADVTDSPTENLSAQIMRPIRVIQTIKPVALTNPEEGVWVYDFGQNFSGWCRLSVSGPAGAEVVLKHAELIYPDGRANQENLRSAKATDRYILKGEGTEVYEPRFTYHGFRYVQVEGFPGTPDLGALLGVVVHTDIPEDGEFRCSNALINQIQSNSVWGFRTNWHSIPTDCPQRDERQGWMGDAHMTADMGFYNFDVEAAYSGFMSNIRDAQGEDGRIPDTVPHKWGGSNGDPMWSAAFPFIAWDVYRHTGDMEFLAENYEGLRRYADFIADESRKNGYITTRNHYGDWVSVKPTPADLVSTGGIYRSIMVTAGIAEALGRQEDADRFREVCKNIADAFNAKYLNPETNTYANGSQFSHVWPLELGIVPDEKRQAVVDHLVNDIMVTNNGHLTTGFLGARYLLDVLCKEGHPEVAYTVVTREDYPGWGYMIANGATTIWELWELKTGNGMNSHNHPAFGFVSGWFYAALAGIVPNAEHPGFERFDIKPLVLGDLNEAKASVNTVRGPASSHWRIGKGSRLMDVTIPANSTAAVWVPKAGLTNVEVTEGSKTIWRDGKYVPGADGISGASDEGEWIRFEVGSGSYSFKLSQR